MKIIFIIMLFIMSCNIEKNKEIKKNISIEVIEESGNMYQCIYILRDNKTGIEYIYIRNGDSGGIIRRWEK